MNKLQAFELGVLAFFILLLSAGQVLFKLSAQTTPALDSLAALRSLALNPWLWAALLVYALGTVVWILILQRLPLSLAYPFVSAVFVIVPLAGAWLFHEPLNLRYLAGLALIMVGVALIARGA